MGLAEIWAAIQGVTADPRDRQTLLYATAAESGARPIAQIGGGPGMGYYQIESGQGVTAAQANDPVQATTIFYNRWPVHTCATDQGQLWQTDPDAAANNAANCAERAAAPYGASQRQTERTLWQEVQQMASNPAPPPAGTPFIAPLYPGSPIPNPGGIISGLAGKAGADALKGFLVVLAELFSNHTFWIRVALTVGGFYAILFGIKGLIGLDVGGAAAAAAA